MYYRLEAKNIGDWSSACRLDIFTRSTIPINGSALSTQTRTRNSITINGTVMPRTSARDSIVTHGWDPPDWR